MGYKQSKNRSKKLHQLYEQTKHPYGGVYYDEEKNRLIKYNIHNSKLKDKSTRSTRRQYKTKLQQGRYAQIPRGKSAFYKKLFDYWWELL